MNSEPIVRKLRLGLLLNSDKAPAWVHAMLSDIAGSDYAEIVVVFKLDGKSEPASSGALRHRLLSYYLALDRSVACPKPNAVELCDTAEALLGLPVVDLAAAPHSFKNLGLESVDLILCPGPAPANQQLADASRLGVWVCLQGGRHAQPDAPPGLSEMAQGSGLVASMIVQLAGDGGAGRVIDQAFSKPDHLFVARTENHLLWKTVSLFTRNLRRLQQQGEKRFFERVSKQYPSELVVDQQVSGSVLGQLASHLRRYLRLKRDFYWYSDHWGLLFDFDDELSLSPEGFRPLRPPPGLEWADPHVLYRDGKYYVFIEEVRLETRKGHIAVFELDENGNASPAVTIIDEPYHLAYPFVFEWRDDLWLIPDSRSNRSVDLYRCEEFPHRWVLHKTLMSNVDAVDSTLLRHNDRWWMFTARVFHAGVRSSDDLCLYSCDDPTSDDWTEHPRSPVVSDVSRARPAGRILEQNGRLYRPAQICTPRYGYGIQLRRIEHLTPTHYEEVDDAKIEPNWDRGVVAVHTIARTHRLTMLDAQFRRPRFAG